MSKNLANTSLDAWLVKIEAMHPEEIDLGLARGQAVYDVLKQSGHIKPSSVITIGGTNGKGTTLKLIENACLGAHLRVGSYTSPHIFQFNERLRIDGSNCCDQQFVEAFELVESARQSIPLTYYEFTTLAAFVAMTQANLDVWLLEVGLGGRLDTVNIVDADIAVITSIALDHQAFLGDTREQIGFEKIHIARPNKPVFIGGEDVPSSISTYIQQHTIESFDCSSREISVDGDTWSLSLAGLGAFNDLPMPKIPLENAALGLQVWLYFSRLRQREPFEVPITQLLETTQLFGRMTRLDDTCEIWLDAAHNPAAAKLLSTAIARLPSRKTRAVIGIMADKDIFGTLSPLLDCIDEWLLWPLDIQRALTPKDLKVQLQSMAVKERDITVFDQKALDQRVLDQAVLDPAYRYIVFGSFFTLESFMQWRCAD